MNTPNPRRLSAIALSTAIALAAVALPADAGAEDTNAASAGRVPRPRRAARHD